MKAIAGIIFYLLIVFSCAPVSTLYLVRHAEKVDSSKDPDLSEAGRIRANRLATTLEHRQIKNIYSTNFKRTRQTAAPLSDLSQVSIQFYSPDTLTQFAHMLKKQQANSLVIGHSNSTISLLDALGLQHHIKVIEDTDYSNFFKITKKGKAGKMKLEELKY